MQNILCKENLEKVLNIYFTKPTIIFLFPGLGVGNIYNELAGCTLQTHEMEVLAKSYKNIDFIGISTQLVPNNNSYINYIQIQKDIAQYFDTTKKEKETYLKRVTYIINDKIEIYKNTSTNLHIKFVKEKLSK